MIAFLLLDILVPGLIVVGLAWALRAPDDPYFAGLRAAIVGFIGSWALVTAANLAESSSLWLGLVMLGPFAEEASRTWFAYRQKDALATPRNWLYFGLGYGLFEYVAKLIGIGLAVMGGGERAESLVGVSVSLSLLVFLGVAMAAMVQRNWPWWLVLPISFAMHAAHNWSTLVWPAAHVGPPTSNLLRIGGFIVLIAAIMLFARRAHPMTSAPSHATTSS